MSNRIYLDVDEKPTDLIGRFVYLSYIPVRCGVIRSAWMTGSFCECKVEWLKTTKIYPEKTSMHRIHILNDFEKFFYEHKRKMKTHEKTLNELKKLKDE